MILIADSGATKTDWLLTDNHVSFLIKTQGINPFHQNEEKIEAIINDELIPQLMSYSKGSNELNDESTPSENAGRRNNKRIQAESECTNQITSVYFYGAGCLATHIGGISISLNKHFSQADIHINTDLLGAARALCGHKPGIACILGTGANSCLYDGQQIQKNISPLGYILGDEGSGAYLGKRFVSDCFKEQLPTFLRDGMLKEFNLTYTDIINKVYKEPQANRFLASLTPYIYKQKEVPEVHNLLIDCFETFFRRNVLPYHSDLPVAFTGSISWYFQEEVKEAAKNLGLTTASFIKNPIEGMAVYHEIN